MLLDDAASPAVPGKQHHDRASPAEQSVRDLDEKARAVAALTIGVETSPGGEPRERLHAQGHRFVTELRSGHETHAAGRTIRGKIPRPGKTRRIQRWGHWPKEYE